MSKWKRIVLAVGGVLLLVLLLAGLILPGIIVDKAREWVATNTGRVLEIESVGINPFGLTISVHKLRLSETDHSQDFVTFDLLRVSLSAASLYYRAPVIDELRLDNPEVLLHRLAGDRFNFSDLLPEGSEPAPEEESGEPFRFSVDNISINGGRIDFVDSSLEKPVAHSIRDLNLILPSIGNFPHMLLDPAQPLFQAVINDSPINLHGELKPFTEDQEMVVDLQLSEIDLPFYLGYIPVDLPVIVKSGKLGLDLDLTYRVSEQSGAELELAGNIYLSSIHIRDKQNEQLFFLPLLQADIAPSQPIKQEIHLSRLSIYNLEVQLNRDRQGVWNHSRMAPPAAAAAAEQAGEETEEEKVEEPSPPFKLLADSIEIRDGVVFFADDLPLGGFRTVAREINIDVDNFALDAKDGIPFRLSLETDHDESLMVDGHFLLDPFSLDLQADLRDISLAAYEPYYQEFYTQKFGGTLSVNTGLSIDSEHPLLVRNGKLSLREWRVALNDKEEVAVDKLDIVGLFYDLAENRLMVDSVSSSDARFDFSRGSDGDWSLMSANFPILAKFAESSKAPPVEPDPTPPGPIFNYQIGEIAVSNWDIHVLDYLPATPARIEVDNLSLKASNLAAPEKVASPVSLDMALQHTGRVSINGSLALADLETSVSTRIRNIPLASLAPYVAEQTNLVLANGFLNADLKATAHPARKIRPYGFGGKLGIDRMHLLDGTHQEDLLSWDSLQIAGIDGGLFPLRLAIDSITLSDYFAKVLIDEEGRLNLTESFRKGPVDEEDEENDAPKEQAINGNNEPPKNAGEQQEIRIDKVTLQGGQVDFTDQSLPHTFHVDMQKLGGRIEGLSSDLDARAVVDLRGSLRNQSPLNITGTINPLAEELFVDLKLSFHDIEMSPFSPYTGTFVGYLIEKGKLNLDLEYTIENSRLKASNKVFLDQFSFGEAVESDQSINLPVKLAVALLKDGKGEIHLDIPVSGSLEDPQFSIAGVVWRVIRNLLVKAATSPFALLGALVGGGEEDFGSVSFAYGSSRLSEAERDKLLRLAQALEQRPNIKTDVSGFVDPERDEEGYRRETLSRQVKRLKYLELLKNGKLPEGVTEEDVIVPEEEYADYLWQVYSEADFPKPRNFIGMTKKLPVEEMEKLIYASTPVTDETLAKLAEARALTVQNFMVESGGLPSERLFLKKPDITTMPDQENANRARVEFGASVR